MIRFGITGAVFQKNGHKSIARWIRDEDVVIETVMKIGAKTYSIASIVGVIDILVGVVDFHAIGFKLGVLVFGYEAGFVAGPICRAGLKDKETI